MRVEWWHSMLRVEQDYVVARNCIRQSFNSILEQVKTRSQRKRQRQKVKWRPQRPQRPQKAGVCVDFNLNGCNNSPLGQACKREVLICAQNQTTLKCAVSSNRGNRKQGLHRKATPSLLQAQVQGKSVSNFFDVNFFLRHDLCSTWSFCQGSQITKPLHAPDKTHPIWSSPCRKRGSFDRKSPRLAHAVLFFLR